MFYCADAMYPKPTKRKQNVSQRVQFHFQQQNVFSSCLTEHSVLFTLLARSQEEHQANVMVSVWSSVWSEVQIVCIDWFYVPGTGLHRLSWKGGR